MTTDDQATIDAIMKEMQDAPESERGPGEDVVVDADPPEVVDAPRTEAPAEAAPAEPAATTEQEPAAPQQTEEQRTVPYQALTAERSKRQELERQLEALRANSEQNKGELATVKEMLQGELSRREEARKAADAEAAKPKRQEHVRVPDPDDDDFSVKALQDALTRNAEVDRHNLAIEIEERARAEAAAALREEMKPITEAYEKHQEDLDRQAQDNALLNAVAEREQAFAASSPDYFDAIQAYKQARYEDMQALGLAPQMALQAVQSEMKTNAAQFLEAKMDPAAAWYSLAQRRGWKAPAADHGALANGGDQPALPSQQQPQRQPGKPSVETMKRGMAASDGLSNVAEGGGAVPNDPAQALDKLLDLPDTELIKRLDDLKALEGRVFQ